MSVIKAKRSESKFEVFHHWYQTRKEITTLMLFDFGLHPERQEKTLLHRLGIPEPSQLAGEALERYNVHKRRLSGLVNWFLEQERNTIHSCIAAVTEHAFAANSIYPTCMAEYEERRLHQDRAIGQCFRLKQELQYIIETLEVDINRYLRIAEMIDKEITLIKAWRKSDNKFKQGNLCKL